MSPSKGRDRTTSAVLVSGKVLGAKWNASELRSFFHAYHQHRQDWAAVAAAVASRSAENCEALYILTQSFLGIPRQYQSEPAFQAIVTDHYENLVGQEAPAVAPSTSRSSKPSRRVSVGRAVSAPTMEDANAGDIASAASPSLITKGRRSSRRPRPGVQGGLQHDQIDINGPSSPNVNVGRRSSVGSSPATAPPKPSVRLKGSSPAKQVPATVDRFSNKRPRSSLMTRAPNGDLDASRTLLFSMPDYEEAIHPKPKSSRGAQRSLKADTSQHEDDEAVNVLLMLQATGPTVSASRAEPAQGLEHGEIESPKASSPQENAMAGEPLQPPAPTDTPSASVRKGKRSRHSTGTVPTVTMSREDVEPSRPETEDLKQHSKRRQTIAAVQEAATVETDQSMEAPEEKVPAIKPRQRRRKPPPERPSLSGISPIKALALHRRALNISSLMLSGFDTTYANRGAQISNSSPDSRVLAETERRLRQGLLSSKFRRWMIYEWFYSALERPWFMQNEMQDYLDHLGLSGPIRLTRTEWAMLRAALGKPRRLSLKFLRDERANLEAYRQAVRARQQQIPVHDFDKLAPELPIPIFVGQRVTAIHPVTRTLHDGCVLIVDEHNSCRVQFDQQDLGVELIHDTCLAAKDPLENLPPVLASVYRASNVAPPLGIGSIHSHVSTLGQHIHQRRATGGCQEANIATAPEEGSTAQIAETPRSEAQILSDKARKCLQDKESLLQDVQRLQSIFKSQLPGEASIDLKKEYTLLILHLHQVDAELEPLMRQLLAEDSSHVLTELEDRALRLKNGLRSFGLDPLPSVSSAVEHGAWVSVLTNNTAADHKPNAEYHTASSSRDTMKMAEALWKQVAQEDLKGALSDNLNIFSPDSHDGARLATLLTASTAILLEVQYLGDNKLRSRMEVDRALDPITNALKPSFKSNFSTYKQIQEQVDLLKDLLSTS